MVKKIFLLFFSMSLFSFGAFFEEEEKDILKKEQYQRQEQRREELQEEKETEKQFQTLPSDMNTAEEHTFYITNILIEDEEPLLNPLEKEHILQGYLHKEIGSTDITNLLTELTNTIIQKGYITSVATLAEDNDLRTQQLVLKIVPGKIEKLSLNQDTNLDYMKKFFLFPIQEGDVLNLRDLDTATENFQYLEANRMTMEILPSKKPNHSVVQVINPMKEKFTLSFLTNNHGENKQNSLWRYGLSLNIDSPLGIGDRFYISYMTVHKQKPNRDWKQQPNTLAPGQISPIGPPGYNPSKGDRLPYKRNLNLYNMRYTLKFRNYTLQLHSSKTFQESSFYTSNTVYDMKSINHTHGIHLDKIVWRNQKNKLSVGIGLKKKRLENYLETSTLADRTLAIGDLSLQGDFILWRGIFGFTMGYERGLRALGAERDTGKLAKTPKAEFHKYTLHANYYKPITQAWTYRMNFAGMYSNDVLYGSEKQTLGGVGSVAGFHRRDSIQGEKALEFENEFSYRLMNSETWGTLTPYISHSYGVMKQNKNDSIYGHGYVSGLLLGLRYRIKYSDFDVAYAKPLHYSSYLNPRNQEIYFSGSIKIRF